jgi:hypothetical protein
MRERRVLCLVVISLLILNFYTITQLPITADLTVKNIRGDVNPNSTTGAFAYPGNVTFYIQNRTNEGGDIDIMNSSGSVESYMSAIEDSILDWQIGDPGVVVVDVENGTYLTDDRAGYVAYTTDLLDGNTNQTFPTVELQKITIPSLFINGTGFINISWSDLNNSNGLMAGYTVYRSTTNDSDGSWSLVGGSVNAPLTELWFNDTTVIDGNTYYYSLKVCFIGYQNDDPGQVDNYQNLYFGEGSAPITSYDSGGIPGAPSELRVHNGGEKWGGNSGDIVLNWTAPTIDFGFLLKNIVYYDLDITDGFQYTNFIEFDPNASAEGDPDWCILPGWDADSNNYSFIVRTTGDSQGGLENLTGTNIGYKYIMTLQKNPGPGTQFKWISIPYHSDYKMASDICGPMKEFTNNTIIDTIVKWNFTLQENDYRHWALFPPPAHWQGDFVIYPGDSLGIIVTTDVAYEWSIVGSHDDSLQFELLKNPAPSTSLKTLSLPYHTEYNYASDISGPGAEFTDGSVIEVVMRWNHSTQYFDYRSWSPLFSSWIGDFFIEPGDAIGFIVSSATSYYWTPEVIIL